MNDCDPWGKYSDGESHNLAHHCADVAACFEAIVELPVLRRRLERAAGCPMQKYQIARLAVLVYLHDCGKLHPGFQAKGNWPVGLWPKKYHGHQSEGAAIFCGLAPEAIARNLHIESLNDWGVDYHLLFSVLAHHGRPFAVSQRAKHGWQAVSHYDPITASSQIGAMIPKWFPDAFVAKGQTLTKASDFQHLLCGLVSLADWIGSERRIFEFVPKLDPNYMRVARERAAWAVEHIGLNVDRWRIAAQGRTDFATLTGGHSARPQQHLVGDSSLDDPLLILEAETGSGKTEAALWRFVRLFETKRVDSLYFALPTRSAAIQIHKRVNEAMRRVFGVGAPEAVLTVPGYLKAGEVEGRKLPNWTVIWDDDEGTDERGILARWAAESTKRALASPVAVGTVDQVMLAALQVKHAHLRASALSRSLLVIDEVHASDHYMTEVQDCLLRIHLNRGGHAILMSATLGSVARTKWLRQQQQPTFETAVAVPYPAVWGLHESGPRHSCSGSKNKEVLMRLIPTMAGETAAKLAIDEARSGARLLIIRNTVREAIAVFRAVQDAGGGDLLLQVNGGPALHHGRFAPEDRGLLDAKVERVLSPYRTCNSGQIVIGTQTLEQSLDIDADLLISDLCPVDVLLQRIGRLHRHLRPRPAGFEQAQCWVLTPEDGLAPLLKPKMINGLGGRRTRHSLEGIYRDVSGLELTRRLIEMHSVWSLPKENRFLVEGATHPDKVGALHDELGKAWVDYSVEIYGKDMADIGAAKIVAVPVDCPFGDLQFPDNEEVIRTRLGSEGARIVFTMPVRGPFGEEITCITLPSHWSTGIDSAEQVVPEIRGNSIHFSLTDQEFTYCRLGLIRAPSKYKPSS